ncbi:hypothetical protein KCP78_22990 [Salmonella enterica subsp. enterica]|nr:hypothetical protein KCP78_22990 [Salmonella enterica subsp. enterica]
MCAIHHKAFDRGSVARMKITACDSFRRGKWWWGGAAAVLGFCGKAIALPRLKLSGEERGLLKMAQGRCSGEC